MRAIDLIKSGAEWNGKNYNGVVYLNGEKVSIEDSKKWEYFIWKENIKNGIITSQAKPANKDLFLELVKLCQKSGETRDFSSIWKLYINCGGENGYSKDFEGNEYSELKKKKYNMTIAEVIENFVGYPNNKGSIPKKVRDFFTSKIEA